MNILVMGGSNSIMADGYVHHLHAALQPRCATLSIRQRSVGATTSLSAIGRLHETFDAAERVDFIVYEYSINDSGHFGWREQAAVSYALCLSLLVQAAARLYPDAVLVPVVFSQRVHFPQAAAHPFHDAQIAAFDALALPTLDLRRALSALFLDRAPAWLYKDDAHYSAPCATSLVGHLVAAHLLALAGRGAAPLRDTLQRLPALQQRFGVAWGGLQGLYVPAVQLAAFAQGPAHAERSGNRLMALHHLRLQPGSRLVMRSEMYPLAFYLKSDAQHAWAQLQLQDAAGNVQHSAFSTHHADTAALPFVYGSIPVPLLFGHRLAVALGPSSFAISVPDAAMPAGPALRLFDCFVRHPQPPPAQRLDLVGVLFVALP